MKLKDVDDARSMSPTPTTSEVADSNTRTIGDDWADFTEPTMDPAREGWKTIQNDATREVLRDLRRLHDDEMTRALSASHTEQVGGREPVWKRRFRTLKASIDQETHPFDEGDNNPLLRKTAVYRVTRKNGEVETPTSVYSAPFTQSEESDPALPIKRSRSDCYVDLNKKSFRNNFGDMHTQYSMRRDESLYSDPFRNIEDPDCFSLETPSSVRSCSFEHSYSSTSSTDVEDVSIASSYSSLSHKRYKRGFGVGRFIDAIGGLRVTKTSTFADEVKNFADLVVDQAGCAQCAPNTRVH